MIQIYKASNTNFEMNGDAVLEPILCDADFELNGAWELELQNPLDENFEFITEDAVVAVETPYGKKQLYRIYKAIKNMAGIKAYARPIFLDAKHDCFLFDVRPINKTGQDALNLMVASNSKYSAKSDISTANTSYYVRKNLIAAINGDDENSFVNRWGGEIVYKNFEITVNERIGADNGLRAEFGYNLEEIEEEIDLTDVVTRIIPVAYNGYTLPDKETIDSPLINHYKTIRHAVIEYSDIKLKEDANETDVENGATICNTLEDLYTALRNKAKLEFENGIDKAAISYTVNMVDLRDADLYKNYECLETVNLGDTVHSKHKRLGIETESRIIKLKWDCIRKKSKELVLGDFQKNIFNDVSSTLNSVIQVINQNSNTLIAERICGVINLLNASMRAQKNIAQKQDVRAILFEDLDTSSDTYGALSIGTQGIQIAKERNETDTDWKWGTAIDFQSINTKYLITGILTDQKGKFYLNMDTGELRMNDGSFVGKVTATSGNIAGFNLTETQMEASTTKTYDYTEADLTRIQNILMGSVTPTTADYQRLDISGDGKIQAIDMVRINKIINAGNKVKTSFTLSPTFDATYNQGVLRVIVDGFHTTKITSIGSLYSTYASLGEVHVGTLYADKLVHTKCMYILTTTSVYVAANGIVPFDSVNVSDGAFSLSGGRITVLKDMTASISALISGPATDARLWAKLRINGSPVTSSISYGSYNTAPIPNYVVNLKAGDIVDVIMTEGITLQTAGLTGSYISIIQI